MANPKASTKEATAGTAADEKGKQEVAQKAGTALAEYGAYEQYAGSGFENQTSDDYAIPFLQILQALSPQLQDPESPFKQGMILNTVTGEVFPGQAGFAYIPSTTQHLYVEWTPREKGGGFVGIHEPGSELVRHCVANQPFGDYKTPEGNELIETFYVYGIAVDNDGNSSEAVLAFSSSKIKKYKAWMTKAKTIQIPLPDGRRIPAPLFAHRYRLKTIAEKNPKGAFFNWEIAFDGANATEARLLPDNELFQSAVAIKKMIDEGRARAAYESQAPGSADDESQGAPAGKPKF